MTTTLPPEIWLIIVKMAVVASACPREAYTIPLAIEPFNGPRMTDRTWGILRLVSPQFKAFAGRAPSFAMTRHRNSIPDNVYAISIDQIHPKFGPLVDNTLPNSHSLVSVTILYQLSHYENYNSVGLAPLFPPSTYLPNLQSLRLIRPQLTDRDLFWENLNRACPSLIHLYVQQGYVGYPSPKDTVLVRLEVLAISRCLPPGGVEFPALKHLTIKEFLSKNVIQASRWQNLESLLLQLMSDIDRRWDDFQWDWTLFPNLRLLGIPASYLYIVKRCPRDHPIRDFHIYSRSRHVNYQRVEITIEHTDIAENSILGPVSPRLRVVSNDPPAGALELISDKCDELRMELVGISSDSVWKRAQYIKSFVPYRRQIQLAMLRVAEETEGVVVFCGWILTGGLWRGVV